MRWARPGQGYGPSSQNMMGRVGPGLRPIFSKSDGPARAAAQEMWASTWAASPCPRRGPRVFTSRPGRRAMEKWCSTATINSSIRRPPCPRGGPCYFTGRPGSRPMRYAKWDTASSNTSFTSNTPTGSPSAACPLSKQKYEVHARSTYCCAYYTRVTAVYLQEQFCVLTLRLRLSAAISEIQLPLCFVALVRTSNRSLGAVVGGQTTIVGVSVT